MYFVFFNDTATTEIYTLSLHDALPISDEIFNVSLSNPTNATLGASNVVLGTIQNDDVLSALAVGGVTVTNVTAGTTEAVFTVSLSPASGGETTVEFSTVDGSALAGTDYTATSGTLTFSAGATARTITVPILGDPLPDTTETFLVNLFAPSANATLQDAQATGTILPAVPIPDLTIGDVSLPEGNAGTTDFVFTLSLSSPASEQIVVGFATGTPASGDLATPGVDYTSTSGTVTFSPSESQAMVTVAVSGDTTLESSEAFLVNLTPVSGTLGTVQSSATGTILNDDGPPTITIDDVTIIAGSAGTIDALFTVDLSVAFDQQITDRKSTRLNSSHTDISRMPSSA